MTPRAFGGTAMRQLAGHRVHPRLERVVGSFQIHGALLAVVLDREPLEDHSRFDLSELKPQTRHVERVTCSSDRGSNATFTRSPSAST